MKTIEYTITVKVTAGSVLQEEVIDQVLITTFDSIKHIFENQHKKNTLSYYIKKGGEKHASSNKRTRRKTKVTLS